MQRSLASLSAFILVLILAGGSARAVQPVFDPAGASFYDQPFPHELRRDADGTLSVSGFPIGNPLVGQYIASIGEVPGFGLNAGVFVKFDGDLDVATLPADPDASRQPGASVFLINIDPRSARRGQRTPLWIGFRPSADAYADARLLVAMPVPGHPLDPSTLYALVVTTDLHGDDSAPVGTPPLMQRMRDEAPVGPFEEAALPLYRMLWHHLEQREGVSRDAVAMATVYRTYDPVAGLVATEKVIRKAYRQGPTSVSFDGGVSTYWRFRGMMTVPQFQTGTPPFLSDTTTGKFVFDDRGRPLVQREDSIEFILAVPKERTDGTVRMPRGGWPIVAYMHGTGGNRFSFTNASERIAERLAAVGVASIGIDQPLHGMRPGSAAGGNDFYNPLNPYALRDNPRQAAADSLTMHQMLTKLRINPALVVDSPGAGYEVPVKPIKFKRTRRMYMGHSQGATTGPLFLGVAKKVQGGVLSAGGGHIIVNVLTREEPFFGGLKLRDLVEALLGTPIDVLHPALHMLQIGSDVSDPVSYAPLFATERAGRPLSLLFTHGMLDGYVTTPMTAAMVVAARYPLVGPTYPPMMFPKLPGYSYQETFDLAGLTTLTLPVSANLGSGRRVGTGGMLLFETDGHFPVFFNPVTVAQYVEFVRSLAYDDTASIPAP